MGRPVPTERQQVVVFKTTKRGLISSSVSRVDHPSLFKEGLMSKSDFEPQMSSLLEELNKDDHFRRGAIYIWWHPVMTLFLSVLFLSLEILFGWKSHLLGDYRYGVFKVLILILLSILYLIHVTYTIQQNTMRSLVFRMTDMVNVSFADSWSASRGIVTSIYFGIHQGEDFRLLPIPEGTNLYKIRDYTYYPFSWMEFCLVFERTTRTTNTVSSSQEAASAATFKTFVAVDATGLPQRRP